MRRLTKGQILPKISTMPRQQSEAAAVLDIYKLAIEKKRLQQELQGIDQRRQQILTRLTVLESQVAELEKKAQEIRDGSATDSGRAPAHRSTTTDQVQSPRSDEFETLFLEY